MTGRPGRRKRRRWLAGGGGSRAVERLALLLQAGELLRDGPEGAGAAFCATRLGEGRGRRFGALPGGIDARRLAALI